jgi:hypothetical protein
MIEETLKIIYYNYELNRSAFETRKRMKDEFESQPKASLFVLVKMKIAFLHAEVKKHNRLFFFRMKMEIYYV